MNETIKNLLERRSVRGYKVIKKIWCRKKC